MAPVLLVVGLITTACGFAPADFTVEIPRSDHSYTVRIYDASGLVVSAAQVAAGAPPGPNGLFADPDSRTLDINWTGGECKRTPVIHIDGSPTALTITVEPDATAGLQLPIFSCSAVGILLGVTLSLNATVSQESVTLVQR